MRIFSTILLAIILLASCASTGRRTKSSEGGQTKVRVDNQNVTSMTIYVLKQSQRIRLGLVSGLSVRVFTLPDDVIAGAAPLRLLADPVGSRRNPISEEFDVSPGEMIEMRIRPF